MHDTFFSCLLFSLTTLNILFSFQLIQETCFLDVKEIWRMHVCIYMYLSVCMHVYEHVCLYGSLYVYMYSCD